MLQAVADLEDAGVSCVPKKIIDTETLKYDTDWAEDVNELYQQLTQGWATGGADAAPPPLCIKPATGGSGIGVAKICR